MFLKKKKQDQSKKDILEERLLEYKAAEQRVTWDAYQKISEILDHNKPLKYVV